MFCSDGHFIFLINTKKKSLLIQDHTELIQDKFLFNWIIDFRGEDL
jgi:hypothetical protein